MFVVDLRELLALRTRRADGFSPALEAVLGFAIDMLGAEIPIATFAINCLGKESEDAVALASVAIPTWAVGELEQRPSRYVPSRLCWCVVAVLVFGVG